MIKNNKMILIFTMFCGGLMLLIASFTMFKNWLNDWHSFTYTSGDYVISGLYKGEGILIDDISLIKINEK